jgi:hypothetical protein
MHDLGKNAEPMRRLAFPRLLLVLMILGLGLGYGAPAHAYAWMIKHGFSKCGSCHTDPSGGETLTKMGRTESEFLLSMGGDSFDVPSKSAQFLWGAIEEPENVRLGGSYRHMVLYSAPVPGLPSTLRQFPMQLDLYGSATFGQFVIGASLGVARGIEGATHVRGAQLNREAGKGWIVLSRSHYLGLWLTEEALLRVGRLNLPFGVRIPEHVMWARESTRTDRESDQQHGASLTYARGRWRTDTMIVIGNFQINPDRYRERGITTSLEYLLTPKLALGGSALLTRAQEDAFTRVDNSVRYAYGVNGRYGLSRQVALLGEFDLLKEKGRNRGYTGFLQADYEPLRGLHFMLTGEVLDQGLLQDGDSVALRGAGAARYGSWITVDWFPAPHFELRLDGVMHQDDVFHGQAQAHIYF